MSLIENSILSAKHVPTAYSFLMTKTYKKIFVDKTRCSHIKYKNIKYLYGVTQYTLLSLVNYEKSFHTKFLLLRDIIF